VCKIVLLVMKRDSVWRNVEHIIQYRYIIVLGMKSLNNWI